MTGKSTTHHWLPNIIDKWTKAHDNGVAASSWTSETIWLCAARWPHGLLYKFGLLCVTPSTLKWIQSYPSNKSLFVTVESTMSLRSLLQPFWKFLRAPTLIWSFYYLHWRPLWYMLLPHQHSCCTPPSSVKPSTNLIIRTTWANFKTVSQTHLTGPTPGGALVMQLCPGKTVLLPVGQTATTACTNTAVIIEDESINFCRFTPATWKLQLPQISIWADLIIFKRFIRRQTIKQVFSQMSRKRPSNTLVQLYLFSYVRPTVEYARQRWLTSIIAEQAD